MSNQNNVDDDKPLVSQKDSFLIAQEAVSSSGGFTTWTLMKKVDLSPRPGDLSYVVNRWMRPDQIALAVYGSANLWWVIALANNVRIPYSEFRPGVVLRVPDPDFVNDLIRSGV